MNLQASVIVILHLVKAVIKKIRQKEGIFQVLESNTPFYVFLSCSSTQFCWSCGLTLQNKSPLGVFAFLFETNILRGRRIVS